MFDATVDPSSIFFAMRVRTDLLSRFISSEVVIAELSIGVAAISTALVGASLVYSRKEQIHQLEESLEKDDAIVRLDRLRRLLVGLLTLGTALCLVCLVSLITMNVAIGIGSFVLTIFVLGAALEGGRRLAT